MSVPAAKKIAIARLVIDRALAALDRSEASALLAEIAERFGVAIPSTAPVPASPPQPSPAPRPPRAKRSPPPPPSVPAPVDVEPAAKSSKRPSSPKAPEVFEAPESSSEDDKSEDPEPESFEPDSEPEPEPEPAGDPEDSKEPSEPDETEAPGGPSMRLGSIRASRWLDLEDDPDPELTQARLAPVFFLPTIPGTREQHSGDPDSPQPTREQIRSRRKRIVRAVTTNMKRFSKTELEAGRTEFPDDHADLRPKTRGDCVNGPRPCPFVSCKHHLWLDVHPKTGAIKFNFPDLEPEQMTVSCVLDIADRGGSTLEEVGALTNLTRERIRQIESRALGRVLKGRHLPMLMEAIDYVPGTTRPVRRKLPLLTEPPAPAEPPLVKSPLRS